MIEVETWQALTGVATVVVAAVVGLAAYRWIPKKDMGASALSTVNAADKAIELLEEAYDRKLADLEERVGTLEQILIEERDKIMELEKERILLLKWISALSEQVRGAGKVPYTMEELKHLDDFGR